MLDVLSNKWRIWRKLKRSMAFGTEDCLPNAHIRTQVILTVHREMYGFSKSCNINQWSNSRVLIEMSLTPLIQRLSGFTPKRRSRTWHGRGTEFSLANRALLRAEDTKTCIALEALHLVEIKFTQSGNLTFQHLQSLDLDLVCKGPTTVSWISIYLQAFATL